MKYGWDHNAKPKRELKDWIAILLELVVLIITVTTQSLWAVPCLFIVATVVSYRSKHSSDYAEACTIELLENEMRYKKLCDNYSIKIPYSTITNVQHKLYRSQSLVIIAIDQQTQIKLSNIEKPMDIVNKINLASKA